MGGAEAGEIAGEVAALGSGATADGGALFRGGPIGLTWPTTRRQTKGRAIKTSGPLAPIRLDGMRTYTAASGAPGAVRAPPAARRYKGPSLGGGSTRTHPLRSPVTYS